MKAPAIILAVIAAFPGAAPAYAKTAAERGAAIVDEWCRDCHQRPGDKPDPQMAPPHDELVKRAGRDRAFYERFMEEDHFPMTIYRLFDKERQDVVEYLLYLQKK